MIVLLNNLIVQKEEMLPNYEMLEDIGFGWYQIRHILIVGLIISCDAAQVLPISISYSSSILSVKFNFTPHYLTRIFLLFIIQAFENLYFAVLIVNVRNLARNEVSI